MVNLIKSGAVVAALLFAYWLGLTNGKNSEELKNARSQIATLQSVVQEFKAKQKSDALALSELRVAESASRNELDRMRQQLSSIERMSGANANRELNRCLRGRIETQELAERLARSVKFCAENHR
ncbi:hypothetical protein [Turicimonas muris]|uniref:hypothetical protein n=1 Tax=Turicimonas muris TaxID=1796652 RepID=UPI001C3E9DEF|nr:hypothetical protein [Turicimonas muris]